MDALATNAELATAPEMGTVTLCRACGRRPVVYDAGLCHRCPALRAPTALRPGTDAKMDLMRDRIAAGLPPFAPGDVHADDLVAGDFEARPVGLYRTPPGP